MLSAPTTTWADTILAANITNYDDIQASIECGTCFLISDSDTFDVASPPPNDVGVITTAVYFDSSSNLYTYTSTVTPSVDDIELFSTASGAAFGFDGIGATTKVGWSFSDATAAGASSVLPATQFEVEWNPSTFRLSWDTEFLAGGNSGWDANEAIVFFFQSTISPGFADYNLSSSDVGTAGTLGATAPEPGSMILLGSGLLGMASALRRRGKKRAVVNPV
jgi:hypothetical protein